MSLPTCELHHVAIPIVLFNSISGFSVDSIKNTVTFKFLYKFNFINSMTMKKTLFYLMVIAIMTVYLTACSNEDNNFGINAELVGTWQKMRDDGILSNVLWVFGSNGTIV